MLCNAAGLAGNNVGLPHSIEQAGLAVVNVTHDNHNGTASDQLVLRVHMIVDQALFDGNNDLALDLTAQLRSDEFRRVEVDGLIDARHNAVFNQNLNQLGRRLFHTGGKLADRDLIGNLDRQRCLLDDLKLQAAHLLLLLVAALVAHGSFLILALILALIPEFLLSAGVILHTLGNQIVHTVIKTVCIDGDGLGVHNTALTLALLLLRLLRLRLCFGSILLRLSRRSFVALALCRLRLRFGSGSDRKDLCNRLDLMMLRNMIEHDIELLVRQHLRVALRLIKINPDNFRNFLRLHTEIRCDFLDSILH